MKGHIPQFFILFFGGREWKNYAKLEDKKLSEKFSAEMGFRKIDPCNVSQG
jgi:hypothetical protein